MYEPLDRVADGLVCRRCERTFGFAEGVPDLVVVGRFEDEEYERFIAYERQASLDTTQNFWIPLFTRLAPTNARVLSVGCGTGVDVGLLREEGYDALGIDCGNRSKHWSNLSHQNRLFLANGKSLPFPDESFDIAFCGCVFPHVGVEGDSCRTTSECESERLELAREMTRVLKAGGKAIVASPNRYFPFDLFHGREKGSYKVRPNPPWNRFLLAFSDYRRLFRKAGCRSATTLPVEGYWGMINSRKNIRGYLLGLPVRFNFWLISRRPMRFLRWSPINPWLVVMIEK